MAEHLSEQWKNTEGTLKDELPKLVGDQYATGEEWRKGSRKNEEVEPKQNNSNGVKKNISEDSGMLGPWIKMLGRLGGGKEGFHLEDCQSL